MNNMDPMSLESLFQKMHDIEGLDSISIWPLAIGWWIVIIASIAIISALIWYAVKWISFRRSWKYETIKQLNHLLNELSNSSISEIDLQQKAIYFSEYLRRIALQRFPRNTCAALTGVDWLKWLSDNDQNKFDWINSGKLLNDVPYVSFEKFKKSNTLNNVRADLLTLVKATKEWVR